MREKLVHWRLVVLFLLAFGVMVVGYLLWGEDRRGILTVAFLDVGQGDAILIDSPTGNQVLVDGGPAAGGAVLRALGAALPFYDRSLDLVIATHPDADHIGGLPVVLERYQVRGFMEPGIVSETQTSQALAQALAAKKITTILARRGQVIDLGRGAKLQILFPDEESERRAEQKNDTNAASIVAVLRYGATSAMLTGDAPIAVEDYLINLDRNNRAELDADILKAGHHGSRTSTSDEWLSATTPSVAIISAGKNNRYGHPHQETLARLTAHQIKTLATAGEGTIVFKTDGVTWWRD